MLGVRHRIYFNSHPRVGGDVSVCRRNATADISIRTPAWGVTGIGVINRLIHVYFNSHPRVGGDQSVPALRSDAVDFNSHPRVGGDIRR